MLSKKIELSFGKVYIQCNILVTKISEGILFDIEVNQKLLNIGREIFAGKNYVYISYRINSYAVGPMVSMESA